MCGRSFGDPNGQSDFTTPDMDGTLNYTLYRRENQITAPSQIWTLIDEDGSTINDSMFMVDMGPANAIPDLPSTVHGSTFEIGFADGHMESMKWQASSDDWASSDGDPDWVKLKSMTTVAK